MKKIFYFLILFILIFFVYTGCEEVFTASPLSGLDRDPSDFDLPRKMEYAREALASGDLTYIKKAYDALDAENSTDGEVCLLTAKCAMELAGMPDLFYAMYDEDNSNGIQLSGSPDTAALDNFANGLNKTYLSAAAVNYIFAVADNADMNATDYFFAGMCALFDSSTGDILNADPDPANNLLLISMNMFAEGPVYDGLFEFTDWINTTL